MNWNIFWYFESGKRYERNLNYKLVDFYYNSLVFTREIVIRFQISRLATLENIIDISTVEKYVLGLEFKISIRFVREQNRKHFKLQFV